MTKIRFEDLPSTNTPINAENLNKLNNVIVSSEEPTTGEEVWLEKGKNLINFQSFKVSSGDGTYGVYGITLLNLKPLTSYVISFTKSRIEGSTISNSALYPWYKIYFYKNDTLLSTESCSSSNVINGFASGSKNLSKQFVTPTECNRVQIFFDNNNGDANLNTLVSNIQLEQGEVATSYEPYVPKKIHTKNGNGYEEFYNEEEHNKVNYSTSEQRIGTWIDGKPIYRKVFEFKATKNINFIVGNLPNFERLVNAYGYYEMGGYIDSLFQYWDDSLKCIVQVKQDNGDVYLHAGEGITKSKSITLTMEYTKTTD